MKVKEFYLLNNLQVIKNTNPVFSKSNKESCLINVYDLKKETVFGFGGALTESSAYNYSLLNDNDKKSFLDKLVGELGLKYHMFRLTIGSSDFSRSSYSYLENENIDNFSIIEDKKCLIPFIKDIINASSSMPFFLASCWSAPSFMKTNNNRTNGGHLNEEYYDLFAEYIIRFIEEYKKKALSSAL